MSRHFKWSIIGWQDRGKEVKVEITSIWRAVQPTAEVNGWTLEISVLACDSNREKSRYKAHSLQDFESGRTVVVFHTTKPYAVADVTSSQV